MNNDYNINNNLQPENLDLDFSFYNTEPNNYKEIAIKHLKEKWIYSFLTFHL